MKNQNPNLIRIAVTTGDRDGIGAEVAIKALQRLGPQPHVQFLIWTDKNRRLNLLKPLEQKFSMVSVTDSAELWRLPHVPEQMIDVASPFAPAQWVFTAAQACMAGLCDALVTGPLSKTGQREAGFKHLGHTELLAEVSGKKNLHMGFVGEHFGVVLATGHMPLRQVASQLTSRRLSEAIEQAFELRRLLPTEKQHLPVAVVGLNPHAGENGLIGKEELSTMKAVLKKFNTKQMHVAGPLVPDAAFLLPHRDQYSIFVSPYHDQGLIPFKLVHGFQQGVHVTMGLPFVRTSVDHGTAKDLFEKNLAQDGSMFDALTAAIYLVQQKKGLQ